MGLQLEMIERGPRRSRGATGPILSNIGPRQAMYAADSERAARMPIYEILAKFRRPLTWRLEYGLPGAEQELFGRLVAELEAA